jgi:hypothetical protein
MEHVSPTMRPLLELFATVDDVMSEHDAFDEANIHKSLGRIYREWLDTREALDPDFDRERYRHEMKSGQAKKVRRSPLGRELPASASPRSSTASTSISEKSRKKSARTGKPSQQKSAPRAKSEGAASTGQSRRESRGEFGEASRSVKGKGSGSGSKGRATPRSPKAKG